MKQTEKQEMLQRLAEEQLKLQAEMAKSDAHAAKCMKLGLCFEEEYTSEYNAYVEARKMYNANEAEIARIEAMEFEEERDMDSPEL